MPKRSYFKLTIFLVLIERILGRDPLLCWVCLPSIKGDEESKLIARDLRTSIIERWNSEADDLRECEFFHAEFYYAGYCASQYGKRMGCVEVSNGHWYARTCSELPPGKEKGFLIDRNYRSSYCRENFCNSANRVQSKVILYYIIFIFILRIS